MEFILNKIDTDIRKKLQEEIKEGKVHVSKGINVKKDLNDKSKNAKEEIDSNEKEQKKYIIVDGIKDDGEKMSIKAEKLETIYEENSKGRILDAKK